MAEIDYKTKCEKQRKEIERLKEKCKEAAETIRHLRTQHITDMHTLGEERQGREQILASSDAVMTEICKKYGEKVVDEDGHEWGYRVIIPKPDVNKRLQIMAKKDDEKGVLIIGAGLPIEKPKKNRATRRKMAKMQ